MKRIPIYKNSNTLYIKNYKTLMKEIKDDTIDGEIYHVHGSEGEGNGTPLQYCCPENPMGGGAW